MADNYTKTDYVQLVKERERLQKQLPAAPFTILRFPDPRLRTHAKPITEVTDEIRDIADKMLTTMYAAVGVGLSATQIDIHKQLIVADVSKDHDCPICLVNPVITEREGELENEEGCLSVPQFFAKVKRAEYVKVAGLDRDGRATEIEADGLLAICMQHEIDHLQGKLFIDHLTPLKRQRLLAHIKKQQKKAAHQAAPEVA